MDKKKVNEDLQKASRIEDQVERWDLFAKVAPAFFLLVCFLLLIVEAVSFQTVFSVGMVLFALTAVTWWFWTIFSIRFLVKLLKRASTGLIDVTTDLSETKKDLKEYVDEENHRRKRH